MAPAPVAAALPTRACAFRRRLVGAWCAERPAALTSSLPRCRPSRRRGCSPSRWRRLVPSSPTRPQDASCAWCPTSADGPCIPAARPYGKTDLGFASLAGYVWTCESSAQSRIQRRSVTMESTTFDCVRSACGDDDGGGIVAGAADAGAASADLGSCRRSCASSQRLAAPRERAVLLRGRAVRVRAAAGVGHRTASPVT